MRTLLIDNHDSFTYNLFQYLAASNAQPPIVVKNDACTWADIEGIEFDNVVISPGPGRPQRQADLGLSADALRFAKVPILGVCLGHQAIAHHCGARVGLAVRPMHGRVDQVSHDGHGIFRGIPSPFQAVRYHSLAATELPDELEPLASAPDGTLMALRHRHKPWWGVQFHPESICTDFGARLLGNFRDLTKSWHAQAQHAHAPAPRPHKSSVATGSDAFAVYVQPVDGFPEPGDVFTRLFAGSESAFWLDSNMAGAGPTRTSYMGDATGPHAELVAYRSDVRQLQISREGGTETRSASVLDYLGERLAASAFAPPHWPFDFAGGFIGYLGYELKGELDGQAAWQAQTPDAMFIFADRFIAFDHGEQQAWIVCLDKGPLSEQNQAWIARIVEALADPRLAPCAQGGAAAASLAQLDWRIPLPAYRELILEAQEEIRQGETYEVCLTNQLVGTGRIDSLQVYRVLRHRNPAPYSAYLRFGDLAVLCASPELFLHLAPDRTLESKPIKGTAKRGSTPAEDADNASTLQADEKTRAENLMIVDLLRNDLNRVCEIGSVHVPGLFQLESYATVHQLVSTIRGRLREDLSIVDCVKACFPGGSMTGAPKERTMRILDDLEGAARGVYAGSLGFMSLNGCAKLNIVIRTIVCDGDQVSIGSGGAIVAMSDANAEIAEIVLKARAQRETLCACGAPPAVDEEQETPRPSGSQTRV